MEVLSGRTSCIDHAQTALEVVPVDAGSAETGGLVDSGAGEGRRVSRIRIVFRRLTMNAGLKDHELVDSVFVVRATILVRRIAKPSLEIRVVLIEVVKNY